MNKLALQPIDSRTIHRYWDHRRNIAVVKIFPGQHYVTHKDEWIQTLLGSCVAVCLRDLSSGLAGMNHFMLPDVVQKNNPNSYYGLYAMEILINDILKQGGHRETLVAKIFGGAQVLDNISNRIGDKNIKFIHEFLSKDAIKLISQDVAGNTGRDVFFHVLSGKAYVKQINRIDISDVARYEYSYSTQIHRNKDEKSLIFFD